MAFGFYKLGESRCKTLGPLWIKMPQDLFHHPHLPICFLDLLVHPLGDLQACCHVADGDTITILDARESHNATKSRLSEAVYRAAIMRLAANE